MTGTPTTSNHPPLPPTSEDDLVDRLRLLRSRRVGPATYRRLIAEFGTARAALDALPGVAAAAGVDRYQICPMGVIVNEIKAARASGACLVALGTPAYPADLAQLPDAPPLMWAIGDTALLQRPMVALVGARNASSLGTRMTKRLAADLSEAGFVVVSGLARGVDAAAHQAALPGGTIAVQAGGVDVIYPTENADLTGEIGRKGLRLSEMPMGITPQARHFPARNRIVSGLARALVVVEAAARSGSLITAQCALDQSREVLAVPGHPMDARAAGCNALIRDGAVLVRSAADVLAALGPAEALAAKAAQAPQTAPATAAAPPPPQAIHEPTQTRPDLRQTARLHSQILARLGPAPIAEDQLIRDLAAAPRTVAPALVDLELDGKIARQPGGLLSRVV